MQEFDEPPPVMLKQVSRDGDPLPAKPYPFRNYLAEVILGLPYWRSSEEATKQAEELLDQVDAEVIKYVVRDGTLEALQKQMQLADATIVQQNPWLIRPALRYSRHLYKSRKHEET